MSAPVIFFVGLAVVLASILALRLHAFLALLLGAFAVAALTPPALVQEAAIGRGVPLEAAAKLAATPIGERIAEGFGRACGQIGILVALASIIGGCLLDSGAAERIVRAALGALGARRVGPAFLGSSFLLGIPVFFDTVFLLMVPLARTAALRTGAGYLLSILAIVAGASMTHCLVPPTPGPLFVAAALGVPLGTMILAGLAVGVFTAGSGYAYARWAGRRHPELAIPQDALPPDAPPTDARRDEPAGGPLPALPLALAPLLVPVLLIAAGAIAGVESGKGGGDVRGGLLAALTEKNAALAVGAALAIAVTARAISVRRTLKTVQEALGTAGQIVLVTAAGGAFGATLNQTGIGAFIGALTREAQLPILPLAFVVTALVRTAQGSTTVAMMTSAGAFGALASAGALGFHPVYLALAICCGSKLVWWMNDSGFWAVSKTSGLSERQALRILTPQGALMGVVGLVATMIGAAVLPGAGG